LLFPAGVKHLNLFSLPTPEADPLILPTEFGRPLLLCCFRKFAEFAPDPLVDIETEPETYQYILQRN